MESRLMPQLAKELDDLISAVDTMLATEARCNKLAAIVKIGWARLEEKRKAEQWIRDMLG